MVDPVTLGPVSRTNGTAPVSTARQRSAAASNAPARQEAPASLPRLVTLAAELANQGPPVDYARIAQIRHAIADGSYAIDPELIAQSILASHGADEE
jgi:negative regulator of flagellin synthesis FlgM